MAKAKKKSETEESGSRIDNIVKAYDKLTSSSGEIKVLGKDDVAVNIPVVPTGVMSLDVALGVGGYPHGRILEIMGPESSGKTTLTLHAIASAQKSGGICAFVDAEHALDINYAQNLGVDLEKLMIMQPGCGEEALSAVQYLAGLLGPGDIIVVDSVAALTPRAEIDGDMGDSHMGLQARLMSQAMRKLTGIVAERGVIVLFINQIRMKIGVMFGSPETTPGGNALKFYASIRIDIRRIGAIKSKEKENSILGNRTRIKVIKNKVAPPFREAEVDIRFGEGIPRANDVFDLALKNGLIVQSGSWYNKVDGEKIGQGKENCINLLKEQPDFLESLEIELTK